MKKIFALPLAVLFVAACGESTAPNATADLTPSYAKPGSGGFTDICIGSGGGINCDVNDTYDFESGVVAAGAGSIISTLLETGAGGSASAATVVEAPAAGQQRFLGRFQNVNTQVLVALPNGYTTYSLTFDFYTIGSWDGKGKQAQQGIFEANLVSIGYICTGASAVNIFTSTFSNQLTVQQDYPASITVGGGNKAATGSYGTDLLGYRGDPSSNTPLFRSFGDVEYTLRFSGANPCGPDQAVAFVIGTSNPSQQSVFDESWGIDNVKVKAT